MTVKPTGKFAMAEEIKHFVSNSSGSKGLMDNIPVYKETNLDLQHISETERLSLPSEEPIDLRDLFPSDCNSFRQDGITHF